MADQRIVVALDVSTTSELKDLVAQIPNTHCRVKIGKELFTSVGPLAVEICHAAGLEVFLDLKFHDIPNTCAKAVLSAARLGVWMTNVHCAGGADMMRAAREILENQAHRPLLVGVTVLTSMSQKDLRETGVERDLEIQVDHLGRLAQQSGLDGVVCSAQETQRLRQSLGDDFCVVTPGIRPSWSGREDQTRIVTPHEAIKNGSDYLVIGRPITASADPEQSIAKIVAEL